MRYLFFNNFKMREFQSSPLRGDKREAFLVCLSVLFIVIYSCSTPTENKLKVTALECEYLTNPMSIDEGTPRLSWKIVSGEDGVMQKAWQVLVASDMEKLSNNEGDLWSSDTVFSDQSTQIKYSGKKLDSRQKAFWKVRVWDNKGNVSDWSDAALWEMAFLNQQDWKAKWIGDKDGVKPHLGQKNPAIYLRKTFEIKELPKQARVYISGIGYYELHINGKKVGNHLLSPNQTNYDRILAVSVNEAIANDGSNLTNFAQRVLYKTFDITDYLHKGKNTVLVTVGSGWYLRTTRDEYLPMSYDNPRMIAQFEILSPTGKLQTVVSDNSWKVTIKGLIVNNNIREGEIYDARLENPAWYSAGFDDSKWRDAKVVRTPRGKLHAQMSPPDRITKEIAPISVNEVRDGVYRYDFGTMFSGWIEINKQGERGKQLKMVYFEEHGNTYDQRDIYIFKGEGKETWEPHFTWHALRYVELTSDSPMTLDDVMGKVVHTDVKQAGEFSSENELFNTISNDYLKTQWDNMHGGVPSDCPHRERRGYTGDGQIAAQAAIYYLDMRAFYTKWLNDIADSQNRKTGYVPNTAPYHSGGGGVAWGSAYVIIPWYMYYYYGDSEILRKHFTGMNQKDFPSFGYNIERGATTLWKTWFGKESHSHPMFGSVCAWFFQGLGGINPDKKTPGFKHTIIKPSVVNDLNFVNATYESVYGKITSEWKVENGNLKLKLTIPANTTATVYVPAKDAASVSVDKKNISQMTFENNRALYDIPSGTYIFKSLDISGILKTPMLAAPVIEPADKTVFKPGSVTVNIHQNTPDAKIRYTLDGTEPDENAELFTKPFDLKNSATVKAKVFREDTKPSFTRRSKIVFVDKEKNGIKYRYYVGSWVKLPDFNKLQSVRTGKIYNFSLDGIDNLSDEFALLLTTTMMIEKAGKYTFTLNSNDGSKLFIDGKLIADSDGLHGFMAKRGTAVLSKGEHKIKLEYFQAGDGRGLELYFESDKLEKQIVPIYILLC